MMWSEKHRPQNISEMIGNEEARTILVEWFAKWKKGTKPTLLVGPPGIGKTTIVNLSEKQFDYDMISLNASDVRSKSRISEVLNPILGNISVLGRPMIFIDEVDGIHGRADFGGTEALIKILKEPTVPIVLAANSGTSTKMRNIKKAVKTIYFRPLPPRLLRSYLENILNKEGEKISPGLLNKIIGESRGDIRSMINSAQAFIGGFNPQTERSFKTLGVEFGVNAFFKANSLDEARSIIYSMSIDPREKINAFYSSIITSNLSQQDMTKMLEIIAKADMLYGKIFKTQEWRLLRYLDEILLGLFKKGTSARYSQYNLSWSILNRLSWDGRKIKALAQIMAKKFHISKSAFATFYFPYILFMIKNKKLEFDVEESFEDVIEKEINRL